MNLCCDLTQALAKMLEIFYSAVLMMETVYLVFGYYYYKPGGAIALPTSLIPAPLGIRLVSQDDWTL